jgi:hypothetical protein
VQLQYTTNCSASVIEFKSLKRKDRCVVCSINRVVITVPLTYISVLVTAGWLIICVILMFMIPNYRLKLCDREIYGTVSCPTALYY